VLQIGDSTMPKVTTTDRIERALRDLIAQGSGKKDETTHLL
jgi:hypothetical protein